MLNLLSFSQVPLEEYCRLSNLAFADYLIGAIRIEAGDADQMLDSGYIDLVQSRIFRRGENNVGFAAISVRGDRARLAGMGIAPEFQRRGYGKAALEILISDLRESGFRDFELEVFEQNPPALALYNSLGFTRLRRLPGFTRSAAQAVAEKVFGLESVDSARAADLCDEFDDLSVPWQCAGWRVRQLRGDVLCYEISGKAVLVAIRVAAQKKLVLNSLFVRTGARRRGLGRKLLTFLAAEYPDFALSVPQLAPEESRPFFEALGFERSPLNQVQMRLML